MKRSTNAIVIFLGLQLLIQNTQAKIVVNEGDGRSMWSTSTTYFYGAADISQSLTTPVVTPSGARIERFDDPNKGILFKDPNGLVWTTTLLASRPMMNYDERLVSEGVSPSYAAYYCKKIGARLPTVSEFESLKKLFKNTKGEYEASKAAEILDPGMPKAGGVYHTALSRLDEYGYHSHRFGFYGTGEQYLRNDNNTWDTDETSEARVKCVISADMASPVDMKARYEALEMPTMDSCEPRQFTGGRSLQTWKSAEVACFKPGSPEQQFISPPEIELQFDENTQVFGSPLIAEKVPGYNRSQVTAIWASRGGGVNGKINNNSPYWFSTQHAQVSTGLVIKPRKDKKGCDVFKIGANDRGDHFEPYQPRYVFTVGIDKKDGSMIVKSNSDKVNFCFERVKDNSILQAVKLKPAN